MKHIFKASVMTAVFAGLILVFAASGAKADQIVGAMSVSGNYIAVNGATGATVPLGSATGIDFTALIATMTPSPGVAGDFLVNSASGGFSQFLGSMGLIKDFSFAGAGSANFPLTPVGSFQTIAAGLTPVPHGTFDFALSTIAITFQSSAILSLTGTGIFSVTGFDATPGTFVFSATSSGTTFSFSASQSATVVPEPASMLLLGTGLLGAAGAIRKRFKAQS